MGKQRVIAGFLNLRGAAQLIPRLSDLDNKGSRGRSLLMAGSEQYPGAGLLAALGALRAGSGYVILAHKNINEDIEYPDIMINDLNHFHWRNIKFDAILVGPGFGVNEFTGNVIEALRASKVENVILDADAITVCAEREIFPLPQSWIVTPHAGELARCLKTTAKDIESNRQKAIGEALDLFGCVVLLKGKRTLVGSKNRIIQISTGNSGLAKAGTGDVLAGVITAFRAAGLSPMKAALLGAYAHGATSNCWRAKQKDLLSMRANDVIEQLPDVLYKIRLFH